MKPGGFDTSLFFCDIVSPPEDESELGLQLEPCDKLEDLQKRVRAKEQKKRAIARRVMAFFVLAMLINLLFLAVLHTSLLFLLSLG